MSRKARNRQTKTKAEISNIVDTPWYKKFWFILVLISSLLSFVLLSGPTAIDNVQILPGKIKTAYASFKVWYHTDHIWTGQWTNEGDLDPRFQPEIHIHLNIEVYDDAVSGSIISSEFPSNHPLSKGLLIRGEKIDDNNIRINVFDFIDGTETDFGNIEAKIIRTDDSQTIHIKTIWQAIRLFPAESTLWRVNNESISRLGATKEKPDQTPTEPRRNIKDLKYMGLFFNHTVSPH